MIQKQTIYFPKNGKDTVFIPIDLPIEKTIRKEGYFFTPEQLNKHTRNVIEQTLETAAEKALLKTEYIDEVYDSNFEDTALPNEEIFLRTDGDGIPYAANKVSVNKESIINTFEETFEKFFVSL